MGAIRHHRFGRLAAGIAAVVALGALAACGGSSDGDASTDEPTTTAAADDATTTAAPDEEAEETTTTSEAAEPEGGGDLTGTWTADAGDILGVNTANLGGTAVECTGPVTLEFREDGTFSQQSEATCTLAGQSGTATIASSGAYEASGGTLTVRDAESSGTFSILGQTQEVPAGLSDGEASYEVDGDTLSITFTEATVGTVTQTYTRA
jgi:hypothetical protein